MEKVFIVDFDNTIANSTKAICDLYNEDYKYYKKFKYVNWCDVNTWDFVELDCAKKEHINLYFNQERFFKVLEFFPLAERNLKTIHDLGYKIIVLSAGYSPNLKVKESWVKEHIPYAEFIGVNLKEYKDKSHIDMTDSIFLDDSENNLYTCNAKYQLCYGDVKSWNENWGGMRLSNWYKVLQFIENLEDDNESN